MWPFSRRRKHSIDNKSHVLVTLLSLLADAVAFYNGTASVQQPSERQTVCFLFILAWAFSVYAMRASKDRAYFWHKEALLDENILTDTS